jgi:hypothetical protein
MPKSEADDFKALWLGCSDALEALVDSLWPDHFSHLEKVSDRLQEARHVADAGGDQEAKDRAYRAFAAYRRAVDAHKTAPLR